MPYSQSELEEAYTQGQKDGFNNQYRAPYSLKIGTGFGTEDEKELKEWYDKGYDNGRSQR